MLSAKAASSGVSSVLVAAYGFASPCRCAAKIRSTTLVWFITRMALNRCSGKRSPSMASMASSMLAFAHALYANRGANMSAVDLGPQRAAHAEQLDEALGLGHAPIGRLRVGGALGVEDVRRRDSHRIDRAAVRLQRDHAIDGGLAGGEKGFQVGLQRVVVEALVHHLHPLARHHRFEAVLLLAEHGLFQRAVRGEQRDQARRLEDDAA